MLLNGQAQSLSLTQDSKFRTSAKAKECDRIWEDRGETQLKGLHDHPRLQKATERNCPWSANCPLLKADWQVCQLPLTYTGFQRGLFTVHKVLAHTPVAESALPQEQDALYMEK